MNKIDIVNDLINVDIDNDKIECIVTKKQDLFPVNVIKLKIKQDTDLDILASIDESTKIDIFINVLPDVTLNLFQNYKGEELKIQSKYYLDINSIVNIYKLNRMKKINEYIIVNLNGEKSACHQVLKTIVVGKEKYDMMVYHNASNTNSDIINHGVNIENGKTIFNISSFVLSDSKNCCVNQTNRIINLTDNKCEIHPNLYIDCYDVTANHSALIGNFKEDELFYLESRGINKNDATNLLIKGFLLSKLDIDDLRYEEYNNAIKQYWR